MDAELEVVPVVSVSFALLVPSFREAADFSDGAPPLEAEDDGSGMVLLAIAFDFSRVVLSCWAVSDRVEGDNEITRWARAPSTGTRLGLLTYSCRYRDPRENGPSGLLWAGFQVRLC